MKILGFKSTFVQEKNNVQGPIQKVESTQLKSENSSVSQDIHIKKFDNINTNFIEEEELDAHTIEKLRKELQSGYLTSEKIADAMINYVKNNSWHKRL